MVSRRKRRARRFRRGKRRAGERVPSGAARQPASRCRSPRAKGAGRSPAAQARATSATRRAGGRAPRRLDPLQRAALDAVGIGVPGAARAPERSGEVVRHLQPLHVVEEAPRPVRARRLDRGLAMGRHAPLGARGLRVGLVDAGPGGAGAAGRDPQHRALRVERTRQRVYPAPRGQLAHDLAPGEVVRRPAAPGDEPDRARGAVVPGQPLAQIAAGADLDPGRVVLAVGHALSDRSPERPRSSARASPSPVWSAPRPPAARASA